MRVSGKTTHRVVSIVLYTSLVVVTLLAGSKGINAAIDTRFHQDFLIQWELAIQKFRAQSGMWPEFTGGNHAAYMEGLLQEMKKTGLTLPSSNTAHPYIYRIRKVGLYTPESELFLLCFPDKIIIYGMPEATFRRTEAFADETPDPGKGRFTGRRGTNGMTYIGVWRL